MLLFSIPKSIEIKQFFRYCSIDRNSNLFFSFCCCCFSRSCVIVHWNNIFHATKRRAIMSTFRLLFSNGRLCNYGLVVLLFIYLNLSLPKKRKEWHAVNGIWFPYSKIFFKNYYVSAAYTTTLSGENKNEFKFPSTSLFTTMYIQATLCTCLCVIQGENKFKRWWFYKISNNKKVLLIESESFRKSICWNNNNNNIIIIE